MIILTRWSFSSSAAIIKMFEADSTKKRLGGGQVRGLYRYYFKYYKKGRDRIPFSYLHLNRPTPFYKEVPTK